MSDIDTLSKFMEWVENLAPGEYLFRGVTAEDHKIEASTYRRLKDKNGNFINPLDDDPEKLLNINLEMLSDARHQKHKRELKDLELLAELQHAEAATCLIDFTRNPFVALWMACRKGSDNSANGKVYAVNVADYKTYKRVNYDMLEEKLPYFFKRNELEDYQIYMWQPDYQKPRMLAQQSVFLFGGAKIIETENCIILNGNKDTIRKALKKRLDIDDGSLFPDFEGFARQRAHNKPYGDHQTLAEQFFEQGQQAVKDGNTDDAIEFYNIGLAYQPESSLQNKLYRERGKVYYYNKKDIFAAISDYTAAISKNPNDDEAYYQRGFAKHKDNRPLEAISDFDDAIALDSSKAEYYHWCAMAHYQLKLYSKSISYLKQAINLTPTDYLNHYWCGMASLNLNQYNDAIYYFDSAININHSEPFLYYWRGMTNSRWGRYREAELDLTNAINRKTDNPTFYFERGKTRKRLNKFDLARQDLQIGLTHAERIGNAKLAEDIRRELYN